MVDFEDGVEFFRKHSGGAIGSLLGGDYVETINEEIDELVTSLNDFEGFSTSSEILKGDVAEFWHAGTFNVDAALAGSKDRAIVDRSHEFASADISTSFGEEYGLKYYSTGAASVKAQSVSVFQRFHEYQSHGGTDSLEEFLTKRGYTDIDSVLNDPIYTGQLRLIPSDQLAEATTWLEKKIMSEASLRPEQVHRYEETLKMLRDKLDNHKGVESIPLTSDEAKALASLAKEGQVTAEKLGLNTDALMRLEYVMKQAVKAGLTAATISMVLKVAPEIFKAIDFLIQTGHVDKKLFKRIGFAALSGGAEGFVRGAISSALTISCKAGLLGESLKSIDPTVIGAITVITLNVVKNAFEVSIGRKTRAELANELLRDMFVSTCSLIGGGITQAFIEIPVLGYLIGSFVGSIVGSFVYNAGYKTALSFCVDTGFTMFGLVEQDYSLPNEILEQLGIETFEYETFEPATFQYESFNPTTFEYESFEPAHLDIVFLRRGVIGVNKIGYV